LDRPTGRCDTRRRGAGGRTVMVLESNGYSAKE
jgi:hypothetical protein